MRTPRDMGYVPLNVIVWSDGKTLVIEGDPPDEEADPDGELHHCDSMGCGWCHVLYRSNLTTEEATQLGWQRAVLEDAKHQQSMAKIMAAKVRAKPGKGPPSEARLKAMERQRAAGNDAMIHDEE